MKKLQRLTWKSDDEYLADSYIDEAMCPFIDKLGQLEDIEDELGIDLITLFKALKNGIWIKYDADFGRTGKPKIKIVKDTATGLCRRGRTWFIQESETKLKDYGKTWALTKEELL